MSSLSFPRLLMLWVSLIGFTLSAEEEPRPQVLPDIPYKEGKKLSAYEAERCKLDLYLPAVKSGYPTLVWLHGGGITAGSKEGKHEPGIARHFAESGVAVAMVNYRLSPKAKFPAYIEDSAAAFAWVKKHIGEHGGDANQVFLGGHSAGAYLALMVGLDSRYLRPFGLGTSTIAGMIPVAGQTLTHYTIRQERGLPKDRILADAGAPLHHARRDAPPMLILYADKDMALRAEENELLSAALRQAGHKRLTVKMIKNRDHSSVAHKMADKKDAGFEEVMKFIRAQQP